MTALHPAVLDDLRVDIHQAVVLGFDPPDVIVTNAAEAAADRTEYDLDGLRSAAERLTAEAMAAHLLAQETWPDETDCDRLDAAFAALEADGVVARQNFSCCGTCGHAEIGEEVATAEGDGRAVRGYTFYHMQDTERAVEGGGVYLKFGAVEGGDRAAERVAADILDALFAHDLKPVWDGSADECVFVPLVWKRRRPAVITAR